MTPTWMLVLHMLIPGQPPESMAVGLLVDPQSCALAGAGMARILSETTPAAAFTWTCAQQGEGV